MGAACAAAVATAVLDVLVVLRAVQGLAGATLLVSGQTILFWNFPASRQPILQAVFAMGSVVAPATAAPFLEGWLIDNHDWRSEERRVGKECVSMWRSRWSPYH